MNIIDELWYGNISPCERDFKRGRYPYDNLRKTGVFTLENSYLLSEVFFIRIVANRLDVRIEFSGL